MIWPAWDWIARQRWSSTIIMWIKWRIWSKHFSFSWKRVGGKLHFCTFTITSGWFYAIIWTFTFSQVMINFFIGTVFNAAPAPNNRFAFIFNFSLGGQTLYLILLNTLAHAIMYTYYLFSNWKPMQKLKKFVTQIQMVIWHFDCWSELNWIVNWIWTILFYYCHLQVQFVIGIMICAGSIAYTSCQKLDWLMFLGVTQYTFLIYIFGIFYKKNYLKKKSL